MNTPNFNALVNGEDAKWAELMHNQFENKSIQEKVDFVQQNEIPVPSEIQHQVNVYVAQLKNKGEKLRAIKRAVARKFNITIV